MDRVLNPRRIFRICFLNEDGYAVNKVNYHVVYNDLTEETGCTSAQYVYIGQDFHYGNFWRNGFVAINNWELTQDTQENTIHVGQITITEYPIAFVSDGEVASVQRLQDTFGVQLYTENPQQVYGNGLRGPIDPSQPIPLLPSSPYENDSLNQQAGSLRNADFRYSDIASGNTDLTLRVSDYLRTKTLEDLIIESGITPEYYVAIGLDAQDETTFFWSYQLSASTDNQRYIDALGYMPTWYSMYGTTADPKSQPSCVATGCEMMSEGFVLYANNALVYECEQYYGTWRYPLIISGTLSTFMGSISSTYYFVTPEINITVSAETHGNYHSSTYVCGSTTLQIVDTSANPYDIVAQREYPVDMRHRWDTDLVGGINHSYYESEFNNTVTFDLLGCHMVSTHTYEMQIICGLNIYLVKHEWCFDYPKFVCGLTKCHLNIPTQVLMYGHQ